MAGTYDPGRIARFFDAYADQEWERLDRDAAQRISVHLHRRALERHVKPGDLVLEIGAGPGRFTLELAKLGARITVTDISPVQLDMNRRRVAEAGYEGTVSQWAIADITGLDAFPDSSFDGVVALGGPLSYALDKREQAVGELRRVTKPEGYIVLSVMSRVGPFRRYLGFAQEVYRSGNSAVVESLKASRATGDLTDPAIQTEDHYMHLFTARELRSLLETNGLLVTEMSAANFVTVQNEELLEDVDEDSDFWRFVVDLEERFASEPGALDGGTHIIAVARRASS